MPKGTACVLLRCECTLLLAASMTVLLPSALEFTVKLTT